MLIQIRYNINSSPLPLFKHIKTTEHFVNSVNNILFSTSRCGLVQLGWAVTVEGEFEGRVSMSDGTF